MSHHSNLLVICGPSGSGKTTLTKKLVEEFGNEFGFSVSHTTRVRGITVSIRIRN